MKSIYVKLGDVMDEHEIEEKKKSALELLEEQKRGKELRPVDHSSMEYLPFRKNLYIMPRYVSSVFFISINTNFNLTSLLSTVCCLLLV